MSVIPVDQCAIDVWRNIQLRLKDLLSILSTLNVSFKYLAKLFSINI